MRAPSRGSVPGRLALLAISLLASAVPVSRAAAQQTTTSASGTDSARTVTVSGIVYDSLGATPLAGAEVQLVDAAPSGHVYDTRSDSAGRFTISGVRPGEYLAGFFHSALDALGVSLSPRRITVSAPGTHDVTLAIPGGATVLPAACGARAPHDSSGAMAGVVRQADSRNPVSNATVVVTWTEIRIDARGLHSDRRRVPVTTRDDGTYLACNLPGDDVVIVSAGANGLATGLVEVHVPAAGVTWRDFAVGDSASVSAAPADSAGPLSQQLMRGTATLSGVVRTPDGRPATSARVLVWGTGLTTDTRDGGRFTITGLPAGTFSVEARAIGFEPTRVAVDLTSRAPATVTLTLAKHVTELAAVTVYGKAPPRSRINEFLTRREQGMGHYVTAADIERRPVLTVTDALRMMPGLRVVPGSQGNTIVGRGNCTPAVYVDGMVIFDGAATMDGLVDPTHIAGIEVYDASTTPVQYQSGGCGVVLIWTK